MVSGIFKWRQTCAADNMLTNRSVTVQRKLIGADTNKISNSHVYKLYKKYLRTKLMYFIHYKRYRETRVPVQQTH
jgi:hypothetical protein